MTPATRTQWAARIGLVGAGTLILGVLISAVAYTGRQGQPYRFANHFVSELGELAYSDAAWAFNGSLIIAGLCFTLFLLGVAWQFDNAFRYVFVLSSLVMGISGMLVGFYPMDNLIPHIRVALTFFNMGIVTVGLFSVYIAFSKKKEFPRWLVAPGLVTAFIFFSFLYLTESPSEEAAAESTNIIEATQTALENRPEVWNVAILEWLVIAAIIGWVIAVALYMLRQQAVGQPPAA